jgi:hypothetical protein
MEDTVKIQTSEQLRQEMERIIDAVTAPNSLPGKIMNTTRMNHSEDWDEEGDAKRCDQGVLDTLDVAESAVAIMTKSKLSP